MAFSFPETMKLGDIRLTRSDNGYKDDYHFSVLYRFEGRLQIEQFYEIFSDIEKEFGEVEKLHVDGYDVMEQKEIHGYYLDLKEFSAYGSLPSGRYRYDRIVFQIHGQPVHVDLRNDSYSEGVKYNNLLHFLCFDDTCSGTKSEKETGTEYYLSDGRLVKHTHDPDAFYVWDTDKNEWRKSIAASNDFYGWDSWGDDIKPFHKLDMAEILQDYLYEHSIDAAK